MAMPQSRKETIRAKAVEIIEAQPTGMRYSQLVKQIHEALLDIPLNTIHGNVWNLEVKVPDRVVKPARGVYLATKYAEVVTTEPTAPTPAEAAQEEVQEEQFYEPFAEWLMNELEECTEAIALGGNRFKDKWGTPDVVGIRAPRPSDVVKPPTEIVSAELKIDRAGLIVAFGQACAYKLFSHRSYIVVPSELQGRHRQTRRSVSNPGRWPDSLRLGARQRSRVPKSGARGPARTGYVLRQQVHAACGG